MGWMIEGFSPGRGWKIFSSPPGALCLGVKQQGHEGDNSPPSSAGVKNAWSYTASPQYAFM